MSAEKSTTEIAIKVIVMLLAFVFYPILSIWALNVLFGTDIGITLKTWAAFWVLWNAAATCQKGLKL